MALSEINVLRKLWFSLAAANAASMDDDTCIVMTESVLTTMQNNGSIKMFKNARVGRDLDGIAKLYVDVSSDWTSAFAALILEKDLMTKEMCVVWGVMES